MSKSDAQSKWRKKDKCVRVEVRVPPEHRQTILDYAQSLRDKKAR